MALVVPPRVLLLDEPLSGLDPVERDAFASTLRDIRSRLGVTIVLVEHDVESVVRLADRLVVLDFGVKLADGPTSEILTNTKVREAYFGVGGDGVMATDLAPKKAFTAATLRLENVSHSYGALPALRNVSLDVPAGTVCAILGPNGAGKSTLAATIAGVVPTSPGSVVLDGEDVSRLARHARARRGLSYVPEGGALFPGLTVAENLLVGDRGASRQERKETLEQAADALPVPAPSGGTSEPACSRAASSRWSRSAGCSSTRRPSSPSTSCRTASRRPSSSSSSPCWPASGAR